VLARFRSRLTFSNVAAGLALFVALSTGGAYAANTVFSTDIVNDQVYTADVRNDTLVNGGLTAIDLQRGSVGSSEVLNDNLSSGGLIDQDLRAGSVGTSEVANGAVTTADLADGAVTRAKTADPEAWHYIGDPGEPAFENGWSNYDSAVNHGDATYQHAAYRKDNDGVVHLRGLVKGGTIGQRFFTLQGDYCPWYFHPFPAISSNALARVTVEFVQPWCGVYADFGSNTWISLEGVSYLEWPLAARSAGASASASEKTVHRGLTRSTR
jgi:hypothetical protein